MFKVDFASLQRKPNLDFGCVKFSS